MTPTNKTIANYYGTSERTIANYKSGNEAKQRLYTAMREYFIANLVKRQKDVV